VAASSTANRIVKPGYHIKPEYDLHGLRHRRSNEHQGHVAGELPLTSMIDMFSILVIYLLMNFSATGEIFFINKNLTLPRAEKTSSLETGPLVSVLGDSFVLDSPPEYGDYKDIQDGSPALDRIVATLKELKTVAEEKNIPSQNRVNIQAGEDTQLLYVKRAMTAAVTAGWTNINFVVEKKK
jgi:biopolymer transport protein ExbD